MQAQKFYSSKSNAARAAKAAFGEDFKNLTKLVENEQGFAYVEADTDVIEVSAPVSKRQQAEHAIKVVQGMIEQAQSMANIAVCEKAIAGLYDAREIEEGVYKALLKQASERVEALASAAGEAEAHEAARLQAVEDAKANPFNCRVCPVCGSADIYHGIGDEKTGMVVRETEVGGCHHCDWTFDIGKRRTSVIDNPCRAVWEIADQFKKANGGERPRRKDVLEACAQAGIAHYTARTQYQLWLTTQKEMEQRAAQQAKKA